MTYILQKIEVKNPSQKLLDFVKMLGREKHARMEELRNHKETARTIQVE